MAGVVVATPTAGTAAAAVRDVSASSTSDDGDVPAAVVATVPES